MRYEIRAMSIGEILDMGFRLLRNHFVALAGISALINVPLAVVQSFLGSQPPGRPGGATGMRLLAVAITFLSLAVLSPIVQTAITSLLGDLYLGRDTSIGGAFRKALGIVFPLVGTSLLAGLIAIPAFLALVIPGIWFALGMTVLSPVMILERNFGMTAIRRSLALVKDNRMRALAIGLVVALVSGAVGAGFSFALRVSPLLAALGTGIVTSIVSAFGAAVVVVFYFEIRCRKEAFEIEHLARMVQEGAAVAPASGA